MIRQVPLILAASAILSACSSIVEGTSQEVFVNTNPSGADCSLNRQGISIARISPTPGTATIKKTKYDMTIVCSLYGFHDAKYINESDVAGATFGNIILGGAVGWAIDSAAGADNKYTSPVNITFVPLSEPKPPYSSPGNDAAPDIAESFRDANTPSATSGSTVIWNGSWYGEDGPWDLYLKSENGDLTGQAMRRDAETYQVTGEILPGNWVTGRVAEWGSLTGHFPRVSFVRDGQSQASFQLEKRN